MKHYYTGKGGEAETVANAEMKALETSNLFFDEELKEFGYYIMVGMEEWGTSAKHHTSPHYVAGWSARKLADITGYYTASHLQALCKQNKIARYWIGSQWVIPAEGVIQVYNMHLKKHEKR